MYDGRANADQRYYAVGTGRFFTPDRYKARSGGAHDRSTPGSWNLFAYVGGDPVNFVDHHGAERCDPEDEEDGCYDPCDENPYDPTCVGEGGGGGGGGGGGSGDGGNSGPFNPLTISGFGQALGRALGALATPDCAALFGLAPNSMNAGGLLSSAVAAAATGAAYMLEFGTTSTAGIGANTSEVGIIQTTTDPWAYTNVNGQKVESTRVVISINLAAWSVGSATWQAQVLIHELGHVFDMLLGAGGSAFVNDALPNGQPNIAAEATNAALQQKCIHN